MKARWFVFCAVASLAACGGEGQLAASRPQAPSATTIRDASPAIRFHAACADARLGFARCFALARDDAAGHGFGPNGSPNGYGPADLQSAYKLDVSGGSGTVVAVVDAFDDPNAEADVGVYRSTYGLPACTTKNGCFQKLNQEGQQGNYPSPDQGWALAATLDVDMVSANCPNCGIMLIEANSNSFRDLGAAVTEATKLNATTIGISFGGSEFKNEDQNSPYNAGRPVAASDADNGYSQDYPAASRYVTAVDGTHLVRANNKRGWDESAWSSGGGCTQYARKPPWQKGIGCKTRADPDVAYVADPATGVAIYDSYGYGGWNVVGGTGVGAAPVAAIYALAGNAKQIKDAAHLYSHAGDLFFIRANPCVPVHKLAWNCAVGLGTPDGTKAF